MLLDAVERGRIYQVKFLLESNSVNVNVTDEKGQTALMKAIMLDERMYKTRHKLVRCLLEYGAKANIADKEGINSLMLAAIQGQEEIAAKILQKAILDLDLNAGDHEGNTALLHAASRGHTGIVGLLIRALKRFGLDIDKRNNHGITAMLASCRNGFDECASLLLTQGHASLHIRDRDFRMNACEWAERHSLATFSEVVKLKNPTLENDTTGEFSSQNAEDGFGGEKMRSGSPFEKEGSVVNYGYDDGSRRDSSHEVTKSRPTSRLCSGRISRLTVPTVMHTLSQNRTTPDTWIETPRTDISSLVPNSVLMERETTGRESNAGSHSRAKSQQDARKPVRRMSTGAPNPKTAKDEMLRLLQLYGEQCAGVYRIGFDPSGLPPSGYWPNPLMHLRSSFSGSCESLDMLADLPSRLMTARRRSGAQDLSNSSRRLSVTPGGRRPSALGRARQVSAVAQAGGRSLLAPEAGGRKVSVAVGDRRGSMMNRPVMDRPVLSRRAQSNMPNT